MQCFLRDLRLVVTLSHVFTYNFLIVVTTLLIPFQASVRFLFVRYYLYLTSRLT